VAYRAWNKNLTKDTDPRVAASASKSAAARKGVQRSPNYKISTSPQLGLCNLCGLEGRKGPIKYHEKGCTPTLARLKDVLCARGYIGVNDDQSCWTHPTQIRPKLNCVRVHIVAFTVVYGPVPAGNVVCHTCDVPGCANPNHLWAGTQAENLADMRQKGREWTPPRKRVFRDATCPTCTRVTQRSDVQRDYCSHKCYLNRNK
jgi:hypothetical protein